MASMRGRLARVFSRARVRQILIVNTEREDSNFLYLTGLRGGMFEGSVLLVRRNSMTLFVSPLEYGIAKRERPREMKLVLLDKRRKLRELLRRELKGRRVGINGSFLPYNTYRSLSSKVKARFVDVSEQLSEARLVKDEAELKAIRRAVSVTKRALRAGMAGLKAGMTERQVAAVMDSKILELGATNSFRTIAAFDLNSALPHHFPGGARLRPNSIILLDVGARVGNYCGDMTRTFMFRPNRRSDKYRRFMEMRSVVLEAQRIGLTKMREGVPAGAAHTTAARYIDSYKKGLYKGRFIHSLGHSIGIDIHDGGAGLYPGCKTRLKRNMVFSDEPGIYIEGFGGVRMEDDVIIGRGSSSFI
jgi:Xaa-Pro dipeptidase